MADSLNALNVVYEVLLSAAGFLNVERHTMLSVLTKQDVLCIIPTALHVPHIQSGIKNMNSIHSRIQTKETSQLLLCTRRVFPQKHVLS